MRRNDEGAWLRRNDDGKQVACHICAETLQTILQRREKVDGCENSGVANCFL